MKTKKRNAIGAAILIELKNVPNTLVLLSNWSD